MNTQNITLSLPKDILLKVKLLAVRRGESVSGLLAGELERLVAEDEAYTRAAKPHGPAGNRARPRHARLTYCRPRRTP